MQLEFGANTLYSGIGLTKVAPESRYADDIGQDYGVMETFTCRRSTRSSQKWIIYLMTRSFS